MGAGPAVASPHTRAGEVALASATFAPCSMLTWAYIPAGATANSQALASDIVVALE
jgi:3-polyprenyl-4-hydroxybenzoate decarboxylase